MPSLLPAALELTLHHTLGGGGAGASPCVLSPHCGQVGFLATAAKCHSLGGSVQSLGLSQPGGRSLQSSWAASLWRLPAFLSHLLGLVAMSLHPLPYLHMAHPVCEMSLL